MPNKKSYAAHISESKLIHPLEEHLRKVSLRAKESACVFRSEQWAELAGRWHDLGKYSATFQQMIYEANGIEAHIEPETTMARNHSTAGALHAVEKLGTHGRILAYLIAGHHAGLPDWYKCDAPGGTLEERLTEDAFLTAALKADIPVELLAGDIPTQPPLGGKNGFALWVRMLFSTLVDADFLDTESFYNQQQSEHRSHYPSLSELGLLFDADMQKMAIRTEKTKVNRVRAAVLHDCRQAALLDCGIFSLTVPTGGGKTLSSMAFALDHARHHNKRRIIYAIPYTSIIEQTANVFRSILGDSVIEHHSSLDIDQENHKSRLAAENWDAPIIVTTNVQFFESLFAARTSRCRKLHNIVNSIVILDEAQLMPPAFLAPILNVMNLLTTHYGVTFVLSTATQPALHTMKDSFGKVILSGLNRVQEIIPNPDTLYCALARVHLTMPVDFHHAQSWKEITEEIRVHDSVLVIVNTRKDARSLYQLMPEGTIHLSALMCGEHRSTVIAEIKKRLKKGKNIRVVSTQLVEAGVDLDFPVVYRALAGLDSIAQAAGRCNREGLLKKGKVVVFVPPSPIPAGHLRRAAQKTVSLLSGNPSDPLARENFTQFFELFYHDTDLDKENIDTLLQPANDLSNMQFRTAAMKMKLINNAGKRIFVRYNNTSEQLLDRLRYGGANKTLMRKLQRYSVNIPEYTLKKMLALGDIEEISTDMYAQTSDLLYDSALGMLLEHDPIAAEDTIW